MSKWNAALGDCVSDLTDFTANGSFADLKSNVTYYNDHNYAALVRTTDLNKKDFRPEVFTDERGYNFLEKSRLYGGEIVLANVGSVGKVFRVPKSDIKMTLAPNAYLVRFNPKQVDEEYIFQFLISNFYKGQLFKAIGSTTLQAMNKTSFRSIRFYKPPSLQEQKKIASILRTADSVVEASEAAIEKYKGIKQAMMHDLFTRGLDEHGKLRPLQTDAPELYKQSRLGWVPKDWDVVPISQVAQVNPEKRKATDAPISYIDIESVSDLSVKATTEYSSPDIPSRAQIIVRSGDIITSNVRPNLRAFAHIGKNLDGCICSTGFTNLRPFDISSGYLFAQVQNDRIFLAQLLVKTVGSSYPAVNSTDVANVVIVKPDPSEQTLVEQRFSALDREIYLSTALLLKTKMLKQSLMSDLLSGEVPVKA